MKNELLGILTNENLRDVSSYTELSPEKALILSLCYTIVIAGAMALTYKLSNTELSYNRKFNIALVMLACISTVLLTLVQSNPLFSLGVLGSLSICRIRMNTKDPRDLGFVFWALSIGIASAERAFFAGTICAVVLSIVMIFSSKVIKKPGFELLVIKGDKTDFMRVRKIFHEINGAKLQSENIYEDSFELVYEINLKEKEEEKIIEMLNGLEGIKGVNLLAPETQVI